MVPHSVSSTRSGGSGPLPASVLRPAFLDVVLPLLSSPPVATGFPFADPDPAEQLLKQLVPDADFREDYLAKGRGLADWYQRDLVAASRSDLAPSPAVFALLVYYTKQGFGVNEALNTSPIPATHSQMRDVLNAYITSSIWSEPFTKNGQPVRLYRGAESYDPDLKNLEVGQIFSMPHFVSTSLSEDAALHFAACNKDWCGKGYVFVMDAPEANAKLHYGISEFPEEKEVLLQAGTCFEVTGIDWKTDVDAQPMDRGEPPHFAKIAYVHVRILPEE